MAFDTPLNNQVLDQLFREARTYNGYLDKPVSQSQLNDIWELMKFGPTSANCLPARMLWCTSTEAKEKLAALTMPANGEKIMSAPVSVIIGMDMEFYEQLPELFPHADARSWFVGNEALIEKTAFRNSSLQGAYFIMAARALGLDTGPMSGFDNDAVDAAFFRGTKVKSNFISTLGYGDATTIFDRSPRPGFDRFNTIT
jgi:3-hydroxypropanoate dehydrogenase